MACQVATLLVVVIAKDLTYCPNTLHQQANNLKITAG